MRDFVLIVIVTGLVPLCVVRPFVGVLTWSWLSYMNPHRLTWGVAYDLPFAQIVGIATLIGVLGMLFKRELPKFPWGRETILLILLWLGFLMTTFPALRPDLAWPEFKKISTILLMTFLTIGLTDNERKLRLLLLVIAFSIGFYGFKGGIFSIVTGGNYMVFGPPNSSISDNTAMGLALVIILPLVFYLAASEEYPWLKWALRVAFVLTVLAVMFTYSRGAFVGLAVVMSLLFWGLCFKRKLIIGLTTIPLLVLAIVFVPTKYIDRIRTIENYEQDGSAMSRIGAWKTAWMIAWARPLTGGGFQILDDHDICGVYNPDHAPGQGGVHSVYFEVLAENGFIVFCIYVLLLAFSITSARKIGREALGNGRHQFHYYGRMLAIALIGFAITGAFLEFASFDLYYHLVALVIVLKALWRQEKQCAREGASTIAERPAKRIAADVHSI